MLELSQLRVLLLDFFLLALHLPPVLQQLSFGTLVAVLCKRFSFGRNFLLIGKTGLLLLHQLQFHLLIESTFGNAVPPLGFHDYFSVVGSRP